MNITILNEQHEAFELNISKAARQDVIGGLRLDHEYANYPLYIKHAENLGNGFLKIILDQASDVYVYGTWHGIDQAFYVRLDDYRLARRYARHQDANLGSNMIGLDCDDEF